ncbi:MAG: modified peptide precursor CbpA [Candidatus Omnitrophota bacterium]
MEKDVKNNRNENQEDKKDVIAARKTCKADGIGLSHYILVDEKA